MNSGKHVPASFDELASPRSRSLGVLTAILIALVLFAFAWYFMFSKVSQAQPVADMTDTTSLANTDPFYMLLIGSDTRKNTALYIGSSDDESHAPGNADILVLMRVDPKAHSLTLVTVPRNTVAPGEITPVGDALQENDMEEVVNQVQSITRVGISYYAMTTFAGFYQIYEVLDDGVVVDVSRRVKGIDPITGEEVTVAEGKRQLNTAQATVLARSSDNYAGGFAQQDLLRQEKVRSIMEAIIDYVTDMPEEQIRGCVTVLSKSIVTNMDHSLLVSLVLDYAQHNSQYRIYAGSGPTGSQEANEMAVAADQAAWARIMEVVDAGGNPFEDSSEA